MRIINPLISAAKAGLAKVNETTDKGLETAEKIFLTIGALVIAGGVIAAVSAWVNGQVAQLPG